MPIYDKTQSLFLLADAGHCKLSDITKKNQMTQIVPTIIRHQIKLVKEVIHSHNSYV